MNIEKAIKRLDSLLSDRGVNFYPYVSCKELREILEAMKDEPEDDKDNYIQRAYDEGISDAQKEIKDRLARLEERLDIVQGVNTLKEPSSVSECKTPDYIQELDYLHCRRIEAESLLQEWVVSKWKDHIEGSDLVKRTNVFLKDEPTSQGLSETAVKLSLGKVCLMDELTKLVTLGSCAFVKGCHENEELADWILERFGTPSPSQDDQFRDATKMVDKTEMKLPKNWGKVKLPNGELVDFTTGKKKREFECDECGITHGHSAECKNRPDNFITISRKVAEEWLEARYDNITANSRFSDELRKSLAVERNEK